MTTLTIAQRNAEKCWEKRDDKVMREPTFSIVIHNSHNHWHPENSKQSGIVLMTIIAGFERSLPNFVDRELAYALSDLHLEVSTSLTSFDYLL